MSSDFQHAVVLSAPTWLPHKGTRNGRLNTNKLETSVAPLTRSRVCKRAQPTVHARRDEYKAWLNERKGRENVPRFSRTFNDSKVADLGRSRRVPRHRFSNSNTANPSGYGVFRVVSKLFVVFLSWIEVCYVKVQQGGNKHKNFVLYWCHLIKMTTGSFLFFLHRPRPGEGGGCLLPVWSCSRLRKVLPVFLFLKCMNESFLGHCDTP